MWLGSRARSKRSSCDGGERVDGRDLVDDEHDPAGTGDANELGQRELGPRNVVERSQRAAEVELAVGERQRRGIAFAELDVRFAGGALPCFVEQLRDDVDGDDLADERREREGERARAGARRRARARRP